MTRRFRKRPVVIEAWQNEDDSPFPSWVDAADVGRQPGGVILIDTKEGVMSAQLGDWIIKGVQGEVYPCKPDIFAATYDEVEGQREMIAAMLRWLRRPEVTQVVELQGYPGFKFTMPDPADAVQLLRFSAAFNVWAIEQYLKGLKKDE